MNLKFLVDILLDIKNIVFILNNISKRLIPGISIEDIIKIVYQLPTVNEQKRIVEKVDKLMKICYELDLRIEESKKYREKLMESIFKDNFKA